MFGSKLKELRIKSISRNTAKNILKEHGLDPAPKRSEDTWDAFIKRHFKTFWACDFFTKTVWTMLGPKTFHALFFINVHTRKVHAGITKHPTKEKPTNKPSTVTVDIVKEEDKILVYEHYSEELVFEYNKNKEVGHPEAGRPVCR